MVEMASVMNYIWAGGTVGEPRIPTGASYSAPSWANWLVIEHIPSGSLCDDEALAGVGQKALRQWGSRTHEMRSLGLGPELLSCAGLLEGPSQRGLSSTAPWQPLVLSCIRLNRSVPGVADGSPGGRRAPEPGGCCGWARSEGSGHVSWWQRFSDSSWLPCETAWIPSPALTPRVDNTDGIYSSSVWQNSRLLATFTRRYHWLGGGEERERLISVEARSRRSLKTAMTGALVPWVSLTLLCTNLGC